MKKPIALGVGLIALFIGATMGSADTLPEIAVGSRVVVRSTQLDRAMVGTVLFMDETDVILRLEGRSEPMPLFRVNITSMEILASTEPSSPDEPPLVRSVGLSGPRIGVTYLSDGVRREVADKFALDVPAAVSQFGWQFEKRFFTNRSGLTMVTEWIVLVAGAEQGLFFPSGSWMIGLRGKDGLEIGVGPNVSLAGVGMAAAAGVSLRSGGFNFPVNVAVVPSGDGVRLSMLVGINWQR